MCLFVLGIRVNFLIAIGLYLARKQEGEDMKDLLDKLSSYNIFNYLLPGIIFAVLVEKLTSLKMIQPDIVVAVFFYYFLGSVISRVGSLLIEPALKKIGFVTFADYPDFISASQADPKIEILSEANNMYRTFVAMLVLAAVFKAYDYVENVCPIVAILSPYFMLAGLIALYLFSYRKQTQYITKRVEAVRTTSSTT